jgi:hypothetical protein
MMWSGKPVALRYDGPADVAQLIVRPPKGIEWEIINLWGCHTNAAATHIYWYLVDEFKSDWICDRSLAANTPLFLSDANWGVLMRPLKITHDFYLTLDCVLGAGKQLYYKGFALEKPENYDLLFQKQIAAAMGFTLPIPWRD